MDHQPASSGPCAGTTGAGVSTGQQSVVPPGLFGEYEWTAVHDFWTTWSGRPPSQDAGHHATVFVRVHFRDDQWQLEDQTRFGTIVYERVGSSFLGYFQTTADSISDSSQRAHYVHPFPLSASPWPDPPLPGEPETEQWYRVQILERQLLVSQYPVYKYEIAWTTETWAGPDLEHATFQGGFSSWITKDQVEATGVKVPSLVGSRMLFGDADGIAGWILTDFVGTTKSLDF